MVRRHSGATLSQLLMGLLLIAAPAVAQTPKVASATPSAVRLLAGGSAVDLVLSGAGLGSITGAVAMLNNRRISGLTIEVVRVTPTSAEFRIEADATTTQGSGRLFLVTRAGRFEVPVEVTVTQPPPRLETLDVDLTKVTGGETLELTIGLDRPPSVRGARIRITSRPAGVVSGQSSVTVPIGEDQVTVTLKTTAVARNTTAQLLASFGRVRLTTDVTILASFTPVSITADGLFMTGQHFTPVSITADGLFMTGVRFTPVSIIADGLFMTGQHFTPVSITADGLFMTGLRFTPVSITADGLFMTGQHFTPVSITADGLFMTGQHFTPVSIVADGLFMTGLHFTPVSIEADGLFMTGQSGSGSGGAPAEAAPTAPSDHN